MTAADNGNIDSGAGTLWFAHWLRAVSVCLVVAGHLGLNFWARNAESSALAHFQPMPTSSLERVSRVITDYEHLHAGWIMVAVGFFFLISGFLIPLTIHGKSIGRFLFNRLCRIYPVWLVGLALIAALFTAQQWLAEVPMNVSAAAWVANAATVPDLAYQPTLNPPGWTLFVEVKWYLLCALAAATVGLHRPGLIAGFAVVLTVYAAIAWQQFTQLAVESHAAWVTTQALAWDAPHVCLILIGLCFYNRLRSGWTIPQTWVCGVTCFAAMAIGSRVIDDGSAHRAAKFAGYVIAVGAFALAFAYRDRFRPNRAVGYVADMIFSLYVVHFVLGMVTIALFMRLVDLPLVSTLAALAVVFLVSAAVHHAIEVPAIRFGKSWRARSVTTKIG